MKLHFKPMPRADCVASLGFIVAVVANRFKSKSALTLPFIAWRDIEVIGLTVAMGTLIIAGIRGLRRGDPKKSSISRLLVGLLVGIGLIAVSHIAAYKIETILDQPELAYKKNIEKGLSKQDLSANIRDILLREVVAWEYRQTGQTGEYTNSKGERVKFEPTDEDKATRKSLVIARTSIAELKAMRYIWATILIILVVVGLMIPIRNKGA